MDRPHSLMEFLVLPKSFYNLFPGQSGNGSAVSAGSGLRQEQGIEDRLLGCLCGGPEAKGDQGAVFRDAAGGEEGRLGPVRLSVGIAEGDHNIPASMVGDGSGPGQTEGGPLGQPFQLAGVQGKVCAQDDDDGSVRGGSCGYCLQSGHRHTEDGQVFGVTEIGQDQ